MSGQYIGSREEVKIVMSDSDWQAQFVSPLTFQRSKYCSRAVLYVGRLTASFGFVHQKINLSDMQCGHKLKICNTHNKSPSRIPSLCYHPDEEEFYPCPTEDDLIISIHYLIYHSLL